VRLALIHQALQVTAMERAAMEQTLDDSPVTAAPTEPIGTATAYEAPQGETEQAIAAAWREVFSLERVGRHDNFFELGGNSLLGMDLMDLLATRLGIELPVVMLFMNPTVREMAALAPPSPSPEGIDRSRGARHPRSRQHSAASQSQIETGDMQGLWKSTAVD
jgi:hypothetical protein